MPRPVPFNRTGHRCVYPSTSSRSTPPSVHREPRASLVATPPLTIRYQGGPYDGLVRLSADDQVPAVICGPHWERYEAGRKLHNDGLLVDVTYQHTGQA